MPTIYDTSNSITLFKPIDANDVNITAFNSYKSWSIESGSTVHTAISSRYINERNYKLLTTIDDYFRYYQSIDLLFYKNNNPLQCFGTYNSKTDRYLYQSASIFSIEYKKIGDGIKPKSFRLETVAGAYTLDLKSDMYGNIYDSSLNTSSIITNVQFYEGFNQYFNPEKTPYNTPWLTDLSKPYDRFFSGSNDYVEFVPGVLSNQLKSIGHCAQFNGSGSLVVPGESFNGYYDNLSNYAISFFVSGSEADVLNNRSIICKNGTKSPFHIALQPDHTIGFYVHFANNVASMNSYIDTRTTNNIYVKSLTAVSSSWNHVVCQKSGSFLQIYVNGVLEASQNFTQLSGSFDTLKKINTDGTVYIGGWPDTQSKPYNYVGKLDELRVYNKSLTANQINYLGDLSETGSMLQTNNVGNIFYKQGIGVITSPNYIYHDILNTPYIITYKSTVTRYELSVLAKVQASDFNLSMNSSMIDDTGKRYDTELISSENFTPYITTIGLYNSKGELLVIGKLAQPIKKINNIDINFLVKLDMDVNVNKG